MGYIKIVSKREGFYRAGLRHSKVPHIYKEEELQDKLEMLEAEPMLDVTEVTEKQLKKEVEKGAVLTFELEPEKEEVKSEKGKGKK